MTRRGVPLSRVAQQIPISRRFPALDCQPLLKALCRKPLVYDAATWATAVRPSVCEPKFRNHFAGL